jgi:hypothetical protein
MTRKFRLYWRRETGCDQGTPVELEDLDPAIQSRVAELVENARVGGGEFVENVTVGRGELVEKIMVGDGRMDGPIAVHLPFLDRREWRRRAEALRVLTLVREGSVIRHVPANAAAALRDHAAELIGAHPVWLAAPPERPRRLLAVLGDEAALVDAVITLGGARNLGLVKPFVRQVMATLRSYYDCDMRELAAPLLVEATRALERTIESMASQQERGGAASRRARPPSASSRLARLTSASHFSSTGSDRSSVRGAKHIRSLHA